MSETKLKYFGTDGIRREAGFFTPAFLQKVAKGLVNYGGDNIKVLLGGDTRESSEEIIQTLSEAFETLGIEYGTVGVLPTPAIDYAFYEMGFNFAIDVTASHNPYTDNGLKFFERGESCGESISEAGCLALEAAIENEHEFETVATSLREDLHDEAVSLYREHLLDYINREDLSGLKIGMDCADGATSVINKSALEALGAEVTLIHADSSYGKNINDGCGSTHIEAITELIKNGEYDFGIAFDGDGDRALLVDAEGNLVDGDQIIVIVAEALKLNSVVVTVSCNQGILNWAKDNNIDIEVTPVGNHHVYAAMHEKGALVGGEQNGHIHLPHETCSDGLLVSMMIAKILKDSGTSLKDLASSMTKLPQAETKISANPEQKELLKSSEDVKKILIKYDAEFKNFGGRILVRPSGTENIVRIVVWGEDLEKITELMNNLASELEQAIA